MFRVGTQAEFTATHHLVGGDFGPEGQPHAHNYRVEVVVEGEELGEHDFLVDIVSVKAALATQVERFAGRSLNDDHALQGHNPSVEWFARVLARALAHALELPGGVTVTVWESADAWASYRYTGDGDKPCD